MNLLAILVAAAACGDPPPADSVCDMDGDGWERADCRGADCDDARADVHPDAVDVVGAGRWVEEVASTTGDPSVPRIAIDAHEGAQIVAWERETRTLAHFERRAGEWHRDRADGGVESPSPAGDGSWSWAAMPVSLAGRAADGVHAVFVDAAGTLRHVSGARDVWSSEIIAAGGASGPSIAVHADGSIEVAWVDTANTLVREASNATGSWIETGAWPEAFASPTAIAVDPSGGGSVHLVWVDTSGVHHAVRSSDVWEDELLPIETPAASCEVAVDSRGDAHVTCAGDGRATYGSNASGPWSFVALQPYALFAPALAVGTGPDGAPVAHVALQNDSYRSVVYGSNVDAQWAFETLTRESYWDPVDIAVDGLGDPHLVYLSDGEIHYTRFARPDDVDQDCDGEDG